MTVTVLFGLRAKRVNGHDERKKCHLEREEHKSVYTNACFDITLSAMETLGCRKSIRSIGFVGWI